MEEFFIILGIVLSVLALIAFFLLKKLFVIFRNYPSAIPLVLANLVPVFGVLFWGWTAFPVFFFYWLESIVFVFFILLRIAKITAPEMRLRALVGSLIFSLFFLALQLKAILWLFSTFPRYWWYPAEICTSVGYKVLTCTPFTGPVRDLSPEIWAGLLVFFVSHGFSHLQNFLKKREFLNITGEKEYFKEFFVRTVGFQLVLAFGAAVATMSGSYMPALIFFILTKTIIDARMHIKKHMKLASLAPSTGS